MKKILGLIGKPVEHSLSPHLHNWLIERNDLDYRYHSFEVDKGDLGAALEGARSLGFAGLNVTIPHKERAPEFVDETGEGARLMGAVNTIKFSGDRVIGRNTDTYGFLRSLEMKDFDPSGKSCFVFGAGGGAAAVSFGLAEGGAGEIFIANRTYSRARRLAEKVESAFEGCELEPLKLGGGIKETVVKSDLVVNSTPLGTWPDVDEAICSDPSAFSPDQLVYDLVYNPPSTKFLEVARAGGADTVSGLDMLICQGVESLNIWTGRGFELGEFFGELKEYLEGRLG